MAGDVERPSFDCLFDCGLQRTPKLDTLESLLVEGLGQLFGVDRSGNGAYGHLHSGRRPRGGEWPGKELLGALASGYLLRHQPVRSLWGAVVITPSSGVKPSNNCVQATPDYALLFIPAQASGAPDAERSMRAPRLCE